MGLLEQFEEFKEKLETVENNLNELSFRIHKRVDEVFGKIDSVENNLNERINSNREHIVENLNLIVDISQARSLVDDVVQKKIAEIFERHFLLGKHVEKQIAYLTAMFETLERIVNSKQR